MISPTVMRGLSEEKGSWKIICTSRAKALRAARSRRVVSLPSKITSPEVGV